MESKAKRSFILTGVLFLLFALFTLAVLTVDVQAIGPEGSRVGFAALNRCMLTLCGVHPIWDQITDGTMLIALLTALSFAVLGLKQLIQRRSITKVDIRILLLACYYAFVVASYLIFEMWTVNQRPILVDGLLEASYPSSHTMVTVCIMGAALLLLCDPEKERTPLRRLLILGSALVIIVAVIGRMLSGMHWFTDILGALLLSAAWLMLYVSLIRWFGKQPD